MLKKDIPDYEGLYEMDQNGIVINKLNNKFVTISINGTGYKRFHVYKDGIFKGLNVHRILAILFIDNPNNHPMVDHINQIKTDNRIENLRWATFSQNNTNKSIQSNNTSGYKGISFTKSLNLEYWRVQIMKDKKTIRKRFPHTPEGLKLAVEFYKSQKDLLHTYD